MPPDSVETLIVGAGQAGLAMSHQLRLRGRQSLVLERGRIGERWRSERWDGMRFQTPNAIVSLSGVPLPHTDPNGFASCAEIVDFLTAYAAANAGPVRENTAISALRRAADGTRFLAETATGPVEANNVVVATGPFQRPLVPPLAPIGTGVLQMHANAYRNSAQLPAGAVLVVGAGASGAQIAEELMRAGRQVFLSVSKHRRAPRRYRGWDHIRWWIETGMDKTPIEQRPADRAPLVHSGADGGHTIDFRAFAAKGMVLAGHVAGYEDGTILFADDLAAALAHGDAAYFSFIDFVDAHIARTGLNRPEDPDARALVPAPPSLAAPPLRLNLRDAGVGTIIWATGYGLDFGWIDLPVLDPRGVPSHRYGISSIPGLYFLGLPFLSRMSSSFLFGVGDDAARLAEHIATR